MNKALLDLYTNYLPEIRNSIVQCNWPAISTISKPFFMHVSEEYIHAPLRILFIGRETYGWEKFDVLDDPNCSINLYKKSSEEGRHHNSPFWWFRKSFSDKMGIDENFMKATLWTNLSKIDVDKKTPRGDGSGQLAQIFVKLLVDEIKIVKPDIVLILTKDGHYNWHLNNYGWLQNEVYKEQKLESELKRESILNEKVDRLIANYNLPKHTFQLCHPNRLRFTKGGYAVNASEIIQAIQAIITQN